MVVQDKLISLRKKYNLTQNELGKIAGVSGAAVSAWELGDRSPKILPLKKICSHFGLDIHSFIDDDERENQFPSNVIPMPKTYSVPLIGTIACGEPILAIEEVDETVEVPERVHADFALRCKGDSMIEARIYDGDIVYIRRQPRVENGQIAAVRIGEEATLKKVRMYPDMVILEPANHTMDPLIYRGKELNDIQILGKAVAFTSVMR